MALDAQTLRYFGGTGLQIITKDAWIPAELADRQRTWQPRSEMGRIVRDCLAFLPGEQAAELLEAVSRIVVLESSLALLVRRANGDLEDYGIVGRRSVTTAGVNFIAARLANSSPSNISLFNFHGLGTGSTAENITDTALVTELTTEYNPDSTRATGAQSNPSANVYQTVATNTLDGTPAAALREHGVFSATSAGTLLDRTVFAAITLSSGDGLASTYQLTCTAGG